ncbi:extracellular solute-binding protein, family 3 [Nannocystis exedens]|uniref:Extracellular solute-binding protein, family 3 n=1 Tax=Nannocystis exedens TaxID=54 RepID=A0A1I1Y898_9BACT|nr:transporter substrate-binding domain-containing protein [Nannocystis exedens]PCC71851.1 Bacterial extracellular solute-binding protein, family 3 [Nannocystis exedens]SFE15218.1 extracellular solute-binding protein, family 3 [Nannocystis exedens]
MAARSSTAERLAVVAWLACACDLPRDPQRTAERVALYGVRVGVVLEPPWACQRDGRLAGAEVDLVREFARARGLEVTFTLGGETRLLAALRRFEFDLVIGGLVADSPYADDIGLTRAYHHAVDGEHVLAVPPGENAWTMQLEAYLGRADIDAALARGRADCGDA